MKNKERQYYIKTVFAVKSFFAINIVVTSVTQSVYVLIDSMLTEKVVCIWFAFKDMMINNIYILIASLLSSELLDACIAFNEIISVIIDIYMLITDLLIDKDTRVNVIFIHSDRARSHKCLLYKDLI